MASFTSRIAGWTAGRLKGEKSRKKTMDWMQKTGLGQLLSVAGDAALIGGAVKGAGALKGLITGGAGGAAPVTSIAAPMIDTPVPEAISRMGAGAPAAAAPVTSAIAPRVPSAIVPPSAPASAPMNLTRTKGVESMAGRTAGAIAPPMSAPPVAPTTVPEPSTMQKMLSGAGKAATATGSFIKENAAPLTYGASALSESLASSRKTALEEEQMRLEQERRNRLAELLMPMFQAEVQRYGQSNRG